MSRRPANLTQADIARAVRAAKQAGAREVEVKMGGEASIIIRITASSSDVAVVPEKSIVL
jgi:hypothetical protein